MLDFSHEEIKSWTIESRHLLFHEELHHLHNESVPLTYLIFREMLSLIGIGTLQLCISTFTEFNCVNTRGELILPWLGLFLPTWFIMGYSSCVICRLDGTSHMLEKWFMRFTHLFYFLEWWDWLPWLTIWFTFLWPSLFVSIFRFLGSYFG